LSGPDALLGINGAANFLPMIALRLTTSLDFPTPRDEDLLGGAGPFPSPSLLLRRRRPVSLTTHSRQ
jgi:hypothetical protein